MEKTIFLIFFDFSFKKLQNQTLCLKRGLGLWLSGRLENLFNENVMLCFGEEMSKKDIFINMRIQPFLLSEYLICCPFVRK